MMSELRLEQVCPENSAGLRDFAQEFVDSGDVAYASAVSDPAAYLARVADFAAGRNLPEKRVAGREFWLFRDGHILGNSRLRLALIPEIELDGGNISYNIRPSERRKGYGVELLRHTLTEARRSGLDRVLLTPDPSNTGSIRIIERNGGALLDKPTSLFSGEPLLRFSISLEAHD